MCSTSWYRSRRNLCSGFEQFSKCINQISVPKGGNRQRSMILAFESPMSGFCVITSVKLKIKPCRIVWEILLFIADRLFNLQIPLPLRLDIPICFILIPNFIYSAIFVSDENKKKLLWSEKSGRKSWANSAKANRNTSRPFIISK